MYALYKHKKAVYLLSRSRPLRVTPIENYIRVINLNISFSNRPPTSIDMNSEKDNLDLYGEERVVD